MWLLLECMGLQHSTSQSSATHPYASELEHLWSYLSDNDQLDEADFIKQIDCRDSTISSKIFRFLSLGNSNVSKSFMFSRVEDSLGVTDKERPGTHAPPFWTLIHAIGWSPVDVVQVVCLDSTVAIEAISMNELQDKYPNLESILNSTILSVLHIQTSLPSISGHENISSTIISSPKMERRIRFLLPPTLDNSPTILFSSQSGGMSFRVLAPAIRYYSGGILFLFESMTGVVFGCYTDRTDWTDTVGYDQEARDSFLFQLHPRIAIRRPNRVGSRNFVYMTTANPTALRPLGIGFGGREGSMRIWMDGDDLTTITCMETDATYEPGHVAVSGPEDRETQVRVPIKTIEVWGYGGENSLGQQVRRRESDESVRQDRRKVDKARLVENQFDREVLFANTFKNQQAGNTRLGNG